MHNNPANFENKKFSLEGLKTQLMSLFMLKTSTSTNDDGSSFYKMIYSILTLTVIDNIMSSIPHVTKFVSAYISKNVSEIKILETLTDAQQTKKSSVVVDINLTKSEDYFGDSVLDHITNGSNVKSILFQNKRFVLNNKDSVLVDEQDQIYFKLLNETKTADNSSTSQVIEIFTYKLDMIQLRKFVDKITTEYKYKMQNKLGGKVFYFDELTTSGTGTDNTSAKFSVFTMKEFVTNRSFDNVVGRESKAIKKACKFLQE
jgi:Mor family transcriptional regulator